MALLCRQPVPEADTKLLHPFDATNTARQIGAEKTAVGGFVGEPAHGAKTQIDSSGGELSAGSLLLLAVGLMVEGTSLGTWFTERFNLNPALLTTWRYFRFSIAVTFAVLAVQLLYHFGPNIKQRFRDSLIGAIVAVVTWVGLSYLLGVYFRHFESLNKTYGPLGAAIGLYLWFYLSGFAILLGGEFNFLRGELRNHRLLRSSTLARSEIHGIDAAA